MKSTLKILSCLYQELNVPEVNEAISGKIYIGDTPDTNQEEDITINCLNNPNEYVQSGFINLNIYLPQLQSGRANIDRFDELVDILLPMVTDLRLDSYFFQVSDDKGIFKDQERDLMYFYNIKLEFQTI